VQGGVSANSATFDFGQSTGPISASGEAATNNGSANANPVTNVSNTGSNAQTQSGKANQASDPSNDAVNRGLGRLNQTAGGTTSASATQTP